jgi:general secretion pathway protein D
MQALTPSIPWRLALLSAALLGAAWAPSVSAQAPASVAAPLKSVASGRGAPVTLNFVNAEIEAVARAMGAITGRQVVVDPRVKGSITLTSDKPLSPAAAYNQFLAALRLQAFTVVESAGLDKVVPEADAKLQSGGVNAGGAGISGNQVVTQIFKLNFENANNLLPVLRPLISPNNVINVNPGNNSLVITDYADNLQRMARIIAASDVSNATDLEILPLKHAIASDLAPLVLRLVESSAAPGVAQGTVDTAFKTTIVAEPRSNSLIVRAANPARLAMVRALVGKLDQANVQNSSDSGNIHVVYLKNADATKLAATLRSVLSGSTTPSLGNAGAAGNPAAAQAASAASTSGQIQADIPTNSLIITAPDPQYRQLREVIDKLDARRAQVFIESLIAEVSAERIAEFGVQWQGPIGKAGDTNIGLLGTNFGSGGKNLLSLALGGASGGVLPATGLNLGIAAQNNGVYSLGMLARFLETNADGNTLSTPNLLTLDNEEAKIVIGQNVPFVTGQYTNSNAGGAGSVNPFQTIERKDVGLTLKVKPQISENGTVKLAIFQEVSTVDPASRNSASGLITNKRSIESNVLVDDGSIVVLGGLLQDEFAGNKDRVPGLADIPFLGALFRSESRNRKKTNLMVFLRPVVVRDASGSDALSAARYDQMRSLQKDAQPTSSSVMPVNGAPLFPDAPVNANTNGNTSANTSADSNAAAQPKSKIPPTPLGQ